MANFYRSTQYLHWQISGASDGYSFEDQELAKQYPLADRRLISLYIQKREEA